MTACTLTGCEDPAPAGARCLTHRLTDTARTAWCPTCEGNQTIEVCPPSCNGSHVSDYPKPCPDCAGVGLVMTEQCRHCGHHLARYESTWVDADRDSVCDNTGGCHEPMSRTATTTGEPASPLPQSKGQEPA